MKSTLVLYRKGLCGFFPVLGLALEEKLRGAKCCKYYGPEGVMYKQEGTQEMKRILIFWEMHDSSMSFTPILPKTSHHTIHNV